MNWLVCPVFAIGSELNLQSFFICPMEHYRLTSLEWVVFLYFTSICISSQDHKKVIVCPLMGAVSFIDAEQNFRVLKFSLIEQHGCTKELYTRLRYAKTMCERLDSLEGELTGWRNVADFLPIRHLLVPDLFRLLLLDLLQWEVMEWIVHLPLHSNRLIMTKTRIRLTVEHSFISVIYTCSFQYLNEHWVTTILNHELFMNYWKSFTLFLYLTQNWDDILFAD